MPKLCKNCNSPVESKNRQYCNSCRSKREYRRQLETGLEREPWRYVECSSDDCLNIWKLKKKKLVNGRREGSRFEEYKRSRCSICDNVALKFKRSRK